MDELYWTVALVVFVVCLVTGMNAAYRNGVVDGYGMDLLRIRTTTATAMLETTCASTWPTTGPNSGINAMTIQGRDDVMRAA